MGTFNMSATMPSWMDQEFFEKVIRHAEKDPKAEVFEFEVTPATKPGDNFASAVYRGLIKYKSKYTIEVKSLSVIMKVEADFPPEMKGFKESSFFNTEIEMYSKVLPDIEALWQSIGDKEILFPK